MHLSEAQPLLPQHEAPRMSTPSCSLLSLILILPLVFLLLHFLAPDAGKASIPSHSNNQHLTFKARNDTIHLLSLNTFIRPRFIGFQDYKDARLRDMLPILLEKDLLCLQELFWTSGSRKQRFLTHLSPNFPYAAHAPKPRFANWLTYPPKPVDAGLAILSTHRIIDTGFHMFENSAWNSVDWFVAKGVLYAAVEVLGSAVHVFTTHMQAGDFEDIRKSQIRELVRFVKRVVRDDGVIVIAGDLNIDGRSGYDDDSDSLAYRDMMMVMKQIGVNDMMKRELGQPVTTAGGLFGFTQKNERIDYLFMRCGAVARIAKGGVQVDQLRVEGKDYRTMSDHYAVIADLLFGLR